MNRPKQKNGEDGENVRTEAYDNNGITFDRYTIIIGEDVYTMSANPSHPQGFNQYCCKTSELHLYPTDRRVRIKDLPKEVQRAIRQRRKRE